MINVGALRTAIGQAPRVAIPWLNCLKFTPSIGNPPVFYPGEVTMDRLGSGQRTFGSTRGYNVTATVLTSSADDEAGQAMLDRLLSEGGDADLIGAIEADKTLGGIASSLNVEHIDGYRIYTLGNGEFFGARLRILVIG
jgi:hypothetical protein